MDIKIEAESQDILRHRILTGILYKNSHIEQICKKSTL